MAAEKRDIGPAGAEKGCASCGGDEAFAYWCTTCNRPVAEKRCPRCGLKAQRKKGDAPGRGE